jgi:hypothetical protein
MDTDNLLVRPLQLVFFTSVSGNKGLALLMLTVKYPLFDQDRRFYKAVTD